MKFKECYNFGGENGGGRGILNIKMILSRLLCFSHNFS